MTPERIHELIQILWDEVNNEEDFLKFLSTYLMELDWAIPKGGDVKRLIDLGFTIRNLQES